MIRLLHKPALFCLFSLCAAAVSAQPQHPPFAAERSATAPTLFTTEIRTDLGPSPTYRPSSQVHISYAGDVVYGTTSRLSIPGSEVQFENNTRVVYTYDAAGTRVENWYWGEEGWRMNGRGRITYTPSGILVSSFREQYDRALGWHGSSRKATTFFNGMPTEYLEEEWQQPRGWRPLRRTLYASVEGGTETVLAYWLSAWATQMRWFYPSLTPDEVARRQAELEGPGRILHRYMMDRRIAEMTYATEYILSKWASADQRWFFAEQVQVETRTADSTVVLKHEVDHAGRETFTRTTLRFDGDRLTEVLTGTVWFFPGYPPSFLPTERTVYTYEDGDLRLIEEYDEGGIRRGLPLRRTTATSGLIGGVSNEGEAQPPRAARVTSVQPSPAIHSAVVHFELATPGTARLRLFDALGRHVATLADGMREAGPHTARADLSALPAGLYFVRLEAGGETATHALTVAR